MAGKPDNLDKARAAREAGREKGEARPPLTLAETRSRRESAARTRTAPAVPPLVGNQHFKVYFGNTLVSFARVSNLQASVEHEDVAEGGLNDFIHVLTKPGGTSGTLTLERGVIAQETVKSVMRALAPGRRITVPVTITLYDRSGKKDWQPVRSWGFDDGMVTRWEVTGLDGLGSEVAIEKLEISHAGLVEIGIK